MSNNNEAKVEGNQNIVIQDIKDSTITLNVNGDLTEVQNDLSAVKEILEKFSAHTFQNGKDVYNIDQFDSASFGFITGKKPFNHLLTTRLIEALKPYSTPVNKFLTKATAAYPNWEEKENVINLAQEVITYSYIGVIGVLLVDIIAIGKESLSKNKQQKYITNCGITTKRTLELVCFTLLSKLWDHQEQNFSALSDDQKKVLKKFFSISNERDILETFELLKTLVSVFEQHKIEYPIQELESDKKWLEPDSDFVIACKDMQSLTEMNPDNYALLDCYKAEKQLTIILENLAFLAAYRMVSTKTISYEETRNSQSHYLHRYASLGISVKKETNPEKLNYTNEPINSDAVLFFKGHYRQNINLFPFVIDLNSLKFQEDVLICFYSHRDLDDDSLNYRFLEQNEIENIVFKDIHKSIANTDEKKERMALNELMKDQDKLIDYKLDSVFLMFQNASNSILGQEEADKSDNEELDLSDFADEQDV